MRAKPEPSAFEQLAAAWDDFREDLAEAIRPAHRRRRSVTLELNGQEAELWQVRAGQIVERTRYEHPDRLRISLRSDAVDPGA